MGCEEGGRSLAEGRVDGALLLVEAAGTSAERSFDVAALLTFEVETFGPSFAFIGIGAAAGAATGAGIGTRRGPVKPVWDSKVLRAAAVVLS